MRRYIIYYFLAFFALIALWLGIKYLTTGRLIIKTNRPGTSIALFKLSDKKGQVPVGTSNKNAFDVRLHSGRYLIKVSSKAFGAEKIVEVKARKTSTYVINPVAQSDLEPVASYTGTDLAADENNLDYLDPSTHNLYHIDNQNNLVLVDSDHQFSVIKWANASFGLGRSVNGEFYTINNSSIDSLAVPFPTKDNQSVDFDLSASGQIFLSHGSDVYSRNSGNIKKIYTTRSPSPSLAAWNDKLLVIDGPGDTTNKDIPPSLTVIDQAGQVIAKNSEEAGVATWSKNGKYLVVAGESAELKIFDSQLKAVAALSPSIPASSFSWINDTLFYAVGSALWSYDIHSGLSQVVSSLPANNNLSNLTASSNGSYLYASTEGSNDSPGQIYRYSLDHKKAAYYVYQLPSFLPDSSTACLLNYINFTQPTILGIAQGDAQQVCDDAVNELLSTYALDRGSFNYSFSSANYGD